MNKTLRPRRQLAFYCLIALFAAAVSAIVAIPAIEGSWPSTGPLIALSLLALIAARRETFFADETAMSSSIVVISASVAAFRSDGAILGPVLCAAIASVRWVHVREQQWSKVIVNVAATSLASAASVGVFYLAAHSTTSTVALLAACVPAILTYWLINNLLISLALAVALGDDLGRDLLVLIRSETVMLVFAFAGALCGLVFIEVGTWEGVLALGGVLAAVDVLVISRPRPLTVRAKHAGLPAATARAAALLAAFGVSFEVARAWSNVAAIPLGAVAGVFVIFLATLVLLRRGLHHWDLVLATGVALPDVPVVMLAAVVGAVGAWAGVVGAAAAAGVGLVLFGVRGWLRRRESVEPVRDEAADERALAIVEMALLDGLDGSR